MATLFFPGRHLVNTAFQEVYLAEVLQKSLPADILGERKLKDTDTLDRLVIAITSVNQENSRYTPISGTHRFLAVDRFAQQFRDRGIEVRIVGIPHYLHVDTFAAYTLKEIADQTDGELLLTPENTAVLCSTPAVIDMYRRLGFAILPAELSSVKPESYRTALPFHVIEKIVHAGEKWMHDTEITSLLSAATLSTWKDFPEIPRKLFWLHKDPLLNETGSLTESRNYATYTQGMSNPAMVEVKYGDIRWALLPHGRLVDEGCADGALLARISRDFHEMDLLGIDIAAEYVQQCREKQRQGAFGRNYAHFHQGNVMERLFEEGSITTTVCNSTLHELWSYGEQAKSVQGYLALKYRQLRKGGRIVIRDVVGPENKEQEVYLWCNQRDGSNEDIFKEFSNSEELAEHLKGLSTAARFRRFVEDFLADERKQSRRGEPTKIKYRDETVYGANYFVLRLQDAAEFLSKKDYTQNWKSELHEEFTFWSFSEWREQLQNAGFRIVESSQNPRATSRAYTSEWIGESRYEGKARLFTFQEGELRAMKYPVTNMVLVGEK